MKPKEVRLHQKSAVLELEYGDGRVHALTAEFLRVHSPSAEVQGHGPGQRTLQDGKRDVKIAGVEAQGNYAIKLRFSDGHDSGIYSWDYLNELGENQATLWQRYLDDLSAAGKSREPKFIAVSR